LGGAAGCLQNGYPQALLVMIILGIDPGTAITGFGLIKNSKEEGKVSLIDFGCIKTPAGEEMAKRLWQLRRDLKRLVKEFSPEVMVIERLFFNTNVKTAMTVGQARGVIMLVAAEHKLPIVEYTALQAKLELTGYGRADKKEVEKAVKRSLRVRRKIKPDDAADALAMAICYVKKAAPADV
jgi:crossover junction endodeoxyribonuclease RuvC